MELSIRAHSGRVSIMGEDFLNAMKEEIRCWNIKETSLMASLMGTVDLQMLKLETNTEASLFRVRNMAEDSTLMETAEDMKECMLTMKEKIKIAKLL